MRNLLGLTLFLIVPALGGFALADTPAKTQKIQQAAKIGVPDPNAGKELSEQEKQEFALELQRLQKQLDEALAQIDNGHGKIGCAEQIAAEIAKVYKRLHAKKKQIVSPFIGCVDHLISSSNSFANPDYYQTELAEMKKRFESEPTLNMSGLSEEEIMALWIFGGDMNTNLHSAV